MLLTLLAMVVVMWLVTITVVIGMCISAAQGDRQQPRSKRRRAELRLIA